VKRVKSPAVLAGLLIVCLVSSAAAAPSVNLTIKPTAPVVDESVTVTFTVDKNVPAGSSLNAVLAGTGGCAELAAKELKGFQPSGRHIRLRFRPADQIVGTKSEWCEGRAYVRLTEAKGEHFVRKLAQTYFRFYARP
jgi:hypothetical protein